MIEKTGSNRPFGAAEGRQEVTDEKADIGAPDREHRAEQYHRPPQHARSPRACAQQQDDHRAVELDAQRPQRRHQGLFDRLLPGRQKGHAG
jgi:hypothetical protein